MNSIPSGLWSWAPVAMLGIALAVCIVATWYLIGHRIVPAARALAYGVSVLALLVSMTTGGLHSYVALPWLAALVVASLLLRLRESVLLALVAVLAAFALEIRELQVGPLPPYWAIALPSTAITFAVTTLAMIALLHLSAQAAIDRKVTAGLLAAEKIRLHAQIAERADSLHLMFGGLPVAVALYDPRAVLLYANGPYLEVMGRSLADSLGRSLADLWPRRASSISEPYFIQATEGKPANFRLPFTTPDNVRRDFDVFVAPTSPDGKPSSDTLVLMLDRTEGLRMERALAERETMYSAVVDHAPIAILTQVDGLITYANPAALMMLAADWTGRAVGRPFSEFITDEDRDAVRQRIAALADAPGFAEFRHYRLVALDGQVRDVELAAISVTRDGKQLVELFCVDVTERRLAEEKVRQLTETLELRVAERTSELEAFTTSVSHDLRAPARQVMSASDIMLRKLERPDANIVPMLTALRATAERMNRTIDALLELSRLGRAGIVPAIWPMGAMVDEIRAELSGESSTRNIAWRVGPLPHVFADPQLMRMVMVNLLGNAIKFTRNKPVSVIEVWSEEFDHMAVIYVRDNGAGFEMTQIDKMFQMFSRLHSAVDFEGTGVGLAHCKRIIERHGGKISAHGIPDKGATVHFTLPRHDCTYAR